MRKKLYIMVGAPGSGKTTYIRTHAAPGHSAHISRDAIRFAKLEEGESYFGREKEVYKTFIRQIIKAFDDCPWVDEVWADATHLTENSRKKLLSNLITVDIDVIPVVIMPELDICLGQNMLRTGKERVPDAIVEKMYNTYEDPANDRIEYDDIIYGSDNK